MQTSQTVQSSAVPRPKARLRESTRQAWWALVFLAPSLVIILLFKLIPVLVGLGVSFTSWSVLAKPTFVGLANYAQLFSDPLVPKVAGNTAYYAALSVPLNILISLGLAVALNQKIRGLTFFRTAYYIPVVTASVAVGVVWTWLLSNNGMVNTLLLNVGLKPVNFLNDPAIALTTVTLVDVWKNLGFNIIILLAALQDVPEEMRDAARVDGAGRWATFRHVVLPLITPAIFFTLVMGVIGALQSFDLVYNMSLRHEGGPARATSTIGFYIWQNAFRYSKMGYAATLSYALFVVLLGLTFIQWRFRKLWVFGEE